jgi:hypothetical protein
MTSTDQKLYERQARIRQTDRPPRSHRLAPRYDRVYTELTYQPMQEPTTMIDTMNQPHTKRTLAALAAVGFLSLANIAALAAELSGTVQGAKQPIAGSTVTLFAAGTDAPKQLARGNSDDSGTFALSYADAPADSVVYVVAKGGTPKAAVANGPNDAIGLMAVLGTTLPKRVTINEFTTIASVWTSAQFLKGDVLSGKPLGLPHRGGKCPQLRGPRNRRLRRHDSGRAQ